MVKGSELGIYFLFDVDISGTVLGFQVRRCRVLRCRAYEDIAFARKKWKKRRGLEQDHDVSVC